MQLIRIRNMKYYLILVLIIFVTVNGSAQEEKKKKTIGIGFFVSPEVNGVLLKGKLSGQSIQPGFGCSGGVEASFAFGEHLLLRTGIGYGYRQFDYVLEDLIFSTTILNNEPPSTARYEMAFHEIQIPVLVHYKFSIPLFIGGGVELPLTFKAPSYRTLNEIPSEGYTTTRYDFTTPFNAVIQLSIGYQFQFKEKYYLMVEPVFRHYLRSFSVPNGNFYSAGLKMSFRMNVN